MRGELLEPIRFANESSSGLTVPILALIGASPRERHGLDAGSRRKPPLAQGTTMAPERSLLRRLRVRSGGLQGSLRLSIDHQQAGASKGRQDIAVFLVAADAHLGRPLERASRHEVPIHGAELIQLFSAALDQFVNVVDGARSSPLLELVSVGLSGRRCARDSLDRSPGRHVTLDRHALWREQLRRPSLGHVSGSEVQAARSSTHLCVRGPARI
eukprot:scaffold52_cov246-Pinguiococcus_pyrenoidosus.AAC.3